MQRAENLPTRTIAGHGAGDPFGAPVRGTVTPPQFDTRVTDRRHGKEEFLKSHLNTGAMALMAVIAALISSQPASADPASQVTLELNKLEPQDKNCRAYLVVGNAGQTAYQSFKLDLVLFQPDGVINKRFALDLAPVKPGKKTVKLFDLDGIGCDKVGSLLVNDVMECKTDAGPAEDCLARLELSSLGQVKISK
jgi:hypothetical protein